LSIKKGLKKAPGIAPGAFVMNRFSSK